MKTITKFLLYAIAVTVGLACGYALDKYAPTVYLITAFSGMATLIIYGFSQPKRGGL